MHGRTHPNKGKIKLVISRKHNLTGASTYLGTIRGRWFVNSLLFPCVKDMGNINYVIYFSTTQVPNASPLIPELSHFQVHLNLNNRIMGFSLEF